MEANQNATDPYNSWENRRDVLLVHYLCYQHPNWMTCDLVATGIVCGETKTCVDIYIYTQFQLLKMTDLCQKFPFFALWDLFWGGVNPYDLERFPLEKWRVNQPTSVIAASSEEEPLAKAWDMRLRPISHQGPGQIGKKKSSTLKFVCRSLEGVFGTQVSAG